MHTRRAVVVQLSALALSACAPTPKPGTGSADSGTASSDGADGTGGTDGTDGTDGTGGDTGGTVEDAWLQECDNGGVELPDDCGMGTPFQSEGPFLRGDVPERTELNVTGDSGDVLILKGRILDNTCAPVEGVVILVWMAGGAERFYDTESADANLYGKQTTGADGAYCFRTLRPTPYGPPENILPAHIHVAIEKDGERLLTTQLYFEADPYLSEAEIPTPPELVTLPEELSDGSYKLHYDFMLPPGPPPE